MTLPIVHWRARLGNELGATAVEYALMVSLIALVIIVAVTAIGTNLSTFFNDAGTQI